MSSPSRVSAPRPLSSTICEHAAAARLSRGQRASRGRDPIESTESRRTSASSPTRLSAQVTSGGAKQSSPAGFGGAESVRQREPARLPASRKPWLFGIQNQQPGQRAADVSLRSRGQCCRSAASISLLCGSEGRTSDPVAVRLCSLRAACLAAGAVGVVGGWRIGQDAAVEAEEGDHGSICQCSTPPRGVERLSGRVIATPSDSWSKND